jgi:hypothetical protein
MHNRLRIPPHEWSSWNNLLDFPRHLSVELITVFVNNTKINANKSYIYCTIYVIIRRNVNVSALGNWPFIILLRQQTKIVIHVYRFAGLGRPCNLNSLTGTGHTIHKLWQTKYCSLPYGYPMRAKLSLTWLLKQQCQRCLHNHLLISRSFFFRT